MKLKIPKLSGFLMLMTFLIGLSYLLTYTIVLGNQGLQDSGAKDQLAIYSDLMYFGFAALVVYLANYFWKGNDKYGDNIGIYNKNETIMKNYTYPQITFLSILGFGVMFLALNLFQLLGKGFFGLKVLPTTQAFSPLDSLIVSTLQIPIAENFMAVFAIGVIALIVTIISVTFDIPPEQHKIYKYAAIIIGLGILGAVWHASVYGGSDITLGVVALFWSIGAMLSLSTGSFIPFVVMHASNNFTIDFTRLYSSDLLLGLSVAFLICVGALYFWIYRKNGDWLKGANRY